MPNVIILCAHDLRAANVAMLFASFLVFPRMEDIPALCRFYNLYFRRRVLSALLVSSQHEVLRFYRDPRHTLRN